MSKSKAVEQELPGIPDGTVPKDIRVGADAVVRMRNWIKEQKEELHALEDTLFMNMAREKVSVCVVVQDGRKHRIFFSPGVPKLTVRAEELVPELLSGKAPKAGA